MKCETIVNDIIGNCFLQLQNTFKQSWTLRLSCNLSRLLELKESTFSILHTGGKERWWDIKIGKIPDRQSKGEI